MNTKLLLIGLLSTFTFNNAFAVEPPPAIHPPTEKARAAGVFTLYFENDYFGGEDQHYTNGIKLSWMSSDLTTWGQEGWRKSFLEALPFANREDGQKNLGLAFGQNIYTPQALWQVDGQPSRY